MANLFILIISSGFMCFSALMTYYSFQKRKREGPKKKCKVHMNIKEFQQLFCYQQEDIMRIQNWRSGIRQESASPVSTPHTSSMLYQTLRVKASAHSFKRFTSRLLKLSFSLYAPITSDEYHA